MEGDVICDAVGQAIISMTAGEHVTDVDNRPMTCAVRISWHSNDFITTDVRAIGLSLSHVIVRFLGTGRIVESLKQTGT